jgi:hypothetical protein
MMSSKILATSFALIASLGATTALALAACNVIAGIGELPGLEAEGDGATSDANGVKPADDASLQTPEAGGADTSTQTESGAPDATMPDTGASDTGPSDACRADACADAATMDAGPTFASLVQIDVRSIFNANTVVTTVSADAGAPLLPMDGACFGCGNDFPTQSKVNALAAAGAVGLPDDAIFAGNGTTVPQVHLWWTNASNVENSVLVSGVDGTTFKFDVPLAQYSQLQIYATSTGGGSTLNVSLDYSTGSPGSAAASIPDWCATPSPASGRYTLFSLNRINEATDTLTAGLVCSVFAFDIDPDPTRSLRSVSFSESGAATDYLVFYGATAW